MRSAEDEALRALPDTEIISALRALPAGYRMAVYYADVEGLSCTHISEIMHTRSGLWCLDCTGDAAGYPCC